jgi:cytochrome c5
MMKNAKRAIALVLGLSFLGLGLAYAKQDEMVEKATLERIQPVGKVNTGGAVVVASGARSGKEIVDATCAACHATGALGSPKVHNKADWSPRMKQGMATLLKHAINGIRSMPPRGGDSSLSDADLKAAITYMTKF